MQIARFWTTHGPRYGKVVGDEIIELPDGPLGDLSGMLGARYRLDEVRLLSPVDPGKVVCGSRNYRTMLKNRGWQEPGEVMLGLKSVSAIVAPGDPVLLPPTPPGRESYVFECELAVVIRKLCVEVSEAEVDDYILGYTSLNDLQVYEIYDKTTFSLHSKNYDSFAPMGPFIQTEMEPDDVWIRSYINGTMSSETHTSDMIYGARKLVSTFSHMMTLMPGDVIATGNAGGKLPVKIGDTIDITIDGVGKLTNTLGLRRYPADAPHLATSLLKVD